MNCIEALFNLRGRVDSSKKNGNLSLTSAIMFYPNICFDAFLKFETRECCNL